MNAHRILAIGALLGALAVVLGAFGAHGLRSRVGPELLEIYETAVRYHFYHALALLAVGVWADRAGPVASSTGVGMAAWAFLAGVVIFSGSLYALVLTGARWLGAVTPIGGVALIIGWGLLVRAALAR